jgi:hypothetical protein
LFLDTKEGDQRQEERRDAFVRMGKDRRQSLLTIELDKRQIARRAETRRDLVNDRRDERT